MALFSKPPAKKPPVVKPDQEPGAGRSRPHSAYELAREAARRQGAEVTRSMEPAGAELTGGSIIDWSASQPAIEVGQANPGLCPVLENAVLLFANGQSKDAALVLEEGIAGDHDTRTSALAWLALFDLLQRLGDRAGFDQLALKYVVQFERSAPIWEAASRPEPGLRAAATGGYVGLSGRLSAASAAQVESIARLPGKAAGRPRLDLSAITEFDDTGAMLLATALGDARRLSMPPALERTEKLRGMLDSALAKGRAGGEGAWLLALELMQWANDQASFDDRAVDFAVTFERSPPSWEPPRLGAAGPLATDEPLPAPTAETETLSWSGTILGTAAAPIASLHEFALSRSMIALDLSRVDRIDFVGAGSLLNAINRIEQQRKSVQIVGATPIIRSLLLLLGVSPRHFVKKAD